MELVLCICSCTKESLRIRRVVVHPQGKHINQQDFLQNLNSSFFFMDTSADIFNMGESSTNVLNLSESELNSLKKSDLGAEDIRSERESYC